MFVEVMELLSVVDDAEGLDILLETLMADETEVIVLAIPGLLLRDALGLMLSVPFMARALKESSVREVLEAGALITPTIPD